MFYFEQTTLIMRLKALDILVFGNPVKNCRYCSKISVQRFEIKQFVVTNSSKERPGSIVTKNLKNGILTPIATSKELNFNADFKYIGFIKISLTHQKLQA